MACSVVGLTGGIGSGKSAVAKRFTELGIPVVNTDDIARQLTAPQGEALGAILNVFGQQVFQDNGELNRQALRQQVFSQPQSRIQLESILHPLIYQRSMILLAQLTGPYAVLEVPLLFETEHYLPLLARTLAVDCEPEQQIARVMARSQLSATDVQAIIATQLTREERCRRADDIIYNNASLEALRLQVDAKHKDYLATL